MSAFDTKLSSRNCVAGNVALRHTTIIADKKEPGSVGPGPSPCGEGNSPSSVLKIVCQAPIVVSAIGIEGGDDRGPGDDATSTVGVPTGAIITVVDASPGNNIRPNIEDVIATDGELELIGEA